MKPKVLMAVNPQLREEIFGDETLQKLESFADVTYHQGPGNMDSKELHATIPEFEGLITCWDSPKITPEIIGKALKLRIISHSAGSVRSYLCEEVFDRGICVTNASSAIAVSVAETTIGLIICSLRYLFDYNDHLRRCQRSRPDYDPAHELTGRTVGIVGMGEVGKRVVGLLKPFHCEILVHDPYKTGEQIEEVGGIPCSLDEVMSRSDIVSVHAPKIPQNRHMISRELLGKLHDGALIVNTARGELIDEEALIDEAKSGRIRCALDVFEGDARQVANELKGVQNVVLTPHIAGRTVESRRRQGDIIVEDIGLFFNGENPKNLVTREMMNWMA